MKPTQTQVKQILSELRVIRYRWLYKSKPPLHFGLCITIEDALDAIDSSNKHALYCVWCDLNKQFAKEWAHYSGVELYPVPDSLADNRPASWAYNSLPRYKGKYGAMRYAYLNYMIDRFSELKE